jgi:hypothetical protein
MHGARGGGNTGKTEGHVMSLDEQLAEILARLGVQLEDDIEPVWPVASEVEDDEPEVRRMASGHEHDMAPGAVVPLRFQAGDELAASIEATADMSLFQTSREHYGVFYRLDLVEGVPQLRIFLPEESGTLKMRCYFVRAATSSPLHQWFATDRAHAGSAAYEDAREAGQQHLLFAAGELMKKLFWSGNVERMLFAPEIEVVRLA